MESLSALIAPDFRGVHRPTGAEGDRIGPLEEWTQLARAQELTVTAEGIESLEQCDRLRELGCDFAQGYVFSHALDAEDAAHAIAADRVWLPAAYS